MYDQFEALSITPASCDGTMLLRLSGELDVAASPRLRQVLLDVIQDGARSIQVDLADVSFIDSTGLNVLVTAMRRLQATDGTLVVVNPRPSTVRLFQIAGLTTFLDIRTSDTEEPVAGVS